MLKIMFKKKEKMKKKEICINLSQNLGFKLYFYYFTKFNVTYEVHGCPF